CVSRTVRLSRRSGFEEAFDQRPVGLDDVLGLQVSAPREKPKFDSRCVCKTAHGSPRNVRIVFGVEDQDLCGCQLLYMMRGVIEDSGAQLGPVLFGEPIPVAECLTDVSRVTLVGGLFLLLLGQDAPINHRTIGDDLIDSWIEGRKNGRRTAEAAA